MDTLAEFSQYVNGGAPLVIAFLAFRVVTLENDMKREKKKTSKFQDEQEEINKESSTTLTRIENYLSRFHTYGGR